MVLWVLIRVLPQTALHYNQLHRRSFPGRGASPPKPLIVDNIFFKTASAHGTYCIPWYIIISKFIKIYYFHYPSGMLEDWIHWNEAAVIKGLLLLLFIYLLQPKAAQHNITIAKTEEVKIVKIRKANYFEKSCFQRKNAWSRFASYCLNCTEFSKLILRKIIKTVATRCHMLKL